MSQRSPDRNRMQTGIEEEENGVVIINCAGYPRIGHGGKERTGMIVRYRPLRLPASAVKAASKPAAARAHCRRPLIRGTRRSPVTAGCRRNPTLAVKALTCRNLACAQRTDAVSAPHYQPARPSPAQTTMIALYRTDRFVVGSPPTPLFVRIGKAPSATMPTGVDSIAPRSRRCCSWPAAVHWG